MTDIKKALEKRQWEVKYHQDRAHNPALTAAKRREAKREFEKAKAELERFCAENGIR
jgi:hypothetical protein